MAGIGRFVRFVMCCHYCSASRIYRQDCTLFTLMLILCVCIVCLHFHCLLCV